MMSHVHGIQGRVSAYSALISFCWIVRQASTISMSALLHGSPRLCDSRGTDMSIHTSSFPYEGRLALPLNHLSPSDRKDPPPAD
ncbi:hypothetical protein C8Q80DRAFT_273566 [Daedaleopsis nitida]|nr:hypothetical protein C8Q80DRAFT_273566 [Daedaleopsis nitida]